jgi:hypothetical protein
LALTGEIWDSPTRIRVSSETDLKDSYLVELTDFQVGGVFNGSCQCRHFICDLRPKLRQPSNSQILRCKHIRWAREHALDFILPVLKRADRNMPDELQT